MKLPWVNSISNRIQGAYIILFILVLVGLFMQWMDLSKLRWQLKMNKATVDFVDSIRDIRRFEKNWFLYKNIEDLKENKKMINHVFSLLTEHGKDYKEISSANIIKKLKAELKVYTKLIEGASKPDNLKKAWSQLQIRRSGQRLITLMHTFQRQEQKIITNKIEVMTLNGLVGGLIVFIVAFILGQNLTNYVVKPLKEIADYTKQISSGNFEMKWGRSNAEEVQTVLKALNIMVFKLKSREKQVIRNTKMATLGTLVAGVAHELNNPLSNILTSAEILNEELKDIKDPEYEIAGQMTRQIVDQSERAKRIVRSLLEFSREKEILLEKIKISELLYEVKNLVKGKMKSKINFKLEIIKDASFLADRQRIGQVLINLILNALHAVDGEGEIILRGTLDENNKKVYIDVEDSGPGISEENLEKIFDPFFTTKDVGEGSGLGLAVSREIIKKHGGDISVQSQEGKGSIFTLILAGE